MTVFELSRTVADDCTLSWELLPREQSGSFSVLPSPKHAIWSRLESLVLRGLCLSAYHSSHLELVRKLALSCSQLRQLEICDSKELLLLENELKEEEKQRTGQEPLEDQNHSDENDDLQTEGSELSTFQHFLFRTVAKNSRLRVLSCQLEVCVLSRRRCSPSCELANLEQELLRLSKSSLDFRVKVVCLELLPSRDKFEAAKLLRESVSHGNLQQGLLTLLSSPFWMAKSSGSVQRIAGFA
jgi:hypothetical protein